MAMTQQTTTEQAPQFSSRAAKLAFEYRTEGTDFIKGVLALMVEDGDQRREHLERVACQLKALHHPIADLVREAARKCPPMANTRFSCYSKVPYIGQRGNLDNLTCWVRSEKRRA